MHGFIAMASECTKLDTRGNSKKIGRKCVCFKCLESHIGQFSLDDFGVGL